MKKIKWLMVAVLITLVASGSIWIAGRSRLQAPQKSHEPAPPTLQPVPQSASPAPLPTVGTVTLAQVQQLYREGQHWLYNSAFGQEYLQSRELLQQARSLLAHLNDGTDELQKIYWRARLEFELGNWYQGAAYGDLGEAQEALPYYETVERLTVELTRRAPDFSEGHRLLGETKMRIISLKGWFHALAHAGAAKNALEKALELDAQNAAARLALGVYYLYAPGLLGGSPERALAELQKIEGLAPDETTRFLAYRWQAIAYAKLGQIEEARQHFLKALEIYPQSGWDRAELRKLQR